MKKLFTVFVLGTLLSLSTQAADAPKTTKKPKMPKMEWTAEQRENMAKMHEGMASCLRTNKNMKECRTEMKTSCQEMMGKEGCPMMGKGMMHDMMYDDQ